MCTIMTFDYATFDANRAVILEQIASDAEFNGDGFSLVLCRADGSVSCNSMDVSVITAMLESLKFERFWLHCRAATGKDIGVAYTHNFRTNTGLLVQHNGVIDNPDGRPVDSMRIVELVNTIGLEHTIEYFSSSGESFFNTFFIEPETGEYTVVRMLSGSLHRDGKGNYSTKAIKTVCDVPVPANYWETHAPCLELLTATQAVRKQDDWRDSARYPFGDIVSVKTTASLAWDDFFRKLDHGEYLANPVAFRMDYIAAGEPDLTLNDLDMVPGSCIDDVFTYPNADEWRRSNKKEKGVC